MTADVKAEAKTPVPPTKATGNPVMRHLTQNIRTTLFAEFQLILLTFCTGIQGKPHAPAPPALPSHDVLSIIR